ncbi:hypothetical protein J4456_00700 [Candidatus Pacearchaeota archaeon]|nr:hypothetical protein [Candidatus Pacearchaeota archaeon]
MEHDVLYRSDKLRITYLHSAEDNEEVISYEAHELWIQYNGEWNKYVIKRGKLKQLALDAQGNNRQVLFDTLDLMDWNIINGLNRGSVRFVEVETAFIEANHKQDEKLIHARSKLVNKAK